MASQAAALRVGMFVILGVAGVLLVIFFLSGSDLRSGAPYETYFSESVQGTDIGTAVKFRGVTVGQITDIGLVSMEYPPPPDAEIANQKVYREVVVRFRVDPHKIGAVPKIAQAVAHGLRVQIVPQGITGIAYLELTFVSPTRFPAASVPWKPLSPVIPSIPSTLTQVQDAVVQALSTFGKIDLGKMVDQLTQLTASLNQEVTRGDAHRMIANAATLLENLNSQVQAADLPATAADARNLLAGPKTQEILNQLGATTRQLDSVSAQLPAVIATSEAVLNQASETTADLQAQLQPVLQNLQTAAQSLAALTEALKNNPAQALTGAQPPPETGK